MPSAREVRLRISSVKNISQVTRALQAVSASKVRKAIAAVNHTRPYATKAWQVLQHISSQPGRGTLHPLLTERTKINNSLVVVISGDRGLAGAYNTNIIRYTFNEFGNYSNPVQFVAVGRKGRDLLYRSRRNVLAEFSNIPAAPTFGDVSAIGRLVVDEFLTGTVDEVYLVYTDFINMIAQKPTHKRLLPLSLEAGDGRVMDFSGGSSRTSGRVYLRAKPG